MVLMKSKLDAITPAMTKRLYLLLVCVLLVACSVPTHSVVPPMITFTPTPTRMTIFTPTPMDTPVPQGKVILVSSGMDASAVQGVVGELSGDSGLVLETRPAVQSGEITQEWKVIIFLAPPANLSEIVRSAPQTQFVVISVNDLEPLPNLSVIRSHPEWSAFVAGYLTMVIAPDWRSAALLPVDSVMGPVMEQVYRNGAGYLCGICNSVTGPVTRFPLVAALPSNSDPTTWQAAVDEINKNIVNTLYVAPEAASRDLLAYLVSKGFVLVGGQTPPEEGRPRWAATVREDATGRIRELWPDVVSGKGGKTVQAETQVLDVQLQFFSQGKQVLVQRMMKDLLSGKILPFNPSY